MNDIEKYIKNLKQYKRDNYFFLRRRILKEDGSSKTLGWIVYKDDKNKTLENKNFFKLDKIKQQLDKE
jgi:hypothetical protein